MRFPMSVSRVTAFNVPQLVRPSILRVSSACRQPIFKPTIASSALNAGGLYFVTRPQDATTLRASSAARDGEGGSDLAKLAVYLALWCILSVGYNITSKHVLNVFPLHATTAVMQLVVALFWVIPQWIFGIRAVPKPSDSNMKTLQKVSLLHGFGHLFAVLSMGLGAVSFVQVVNTMEPVFAAALSALVTGSIMAAPVYASLLPVCAGVAIAAAEEWSFSWPGFGAALMSNLLFASCAVISKFEMGRKDAGENMDSANTFAIITMLSTIAFLPLALILEGSKIKAAWLAAIAVEGMTTTKLAITMVLSGCYLFTCNEFALKDLGLISPVGQTVGNTVKRAVILVATSIAFATPMTTIGIAGSVIAMAGVLVYSWVQQEYDKKSYLKKWLHAFQIVSNFMDYGPRR